MRAFFTGRAMALARVLHVVALGGGSETLRVQINISEAFWGRY
jgi:hypothetical protein